MNRKNEIRSFFEEAGRKVLNRRESAKRADSRAIKDLAEDSKPKSQTGGNGTKQRYTYAFRTEQYKQHSCGSDILLTKHRASYLQIPENGQTKGKGGACM